MDPKPSKSRVVSIDESVVIPKRATARIPDENLSGEIIPLVKENVQQWDLAHSNKSTNSQKSGKKSTNQGSTDEDMVISDSIFEENTEVSSNKWTILI